MSGIRAKEGIRRRSWSSLAAVIVLATVAAGCGGGSEDPPDSGTLVVTVTDTEGRPLVGADVSVFNKSQSVGFGYVATGATGIATIEHLPAEVRVHVSHEFGLHYLNASVAVAQTGSTPLAVTLQPARPRPTVALLPVSIVPGSISADRSELDLEVTLVASKSAPFVLAGNGDPPGATKPYMGFEFAPMEETGLPRECYLGRWVPACDVPHEGPYTIEFLQTDYDPVGTAVTLAVSRPFASATLIIDQSQRVPVLDPSARRSFAARQFIARALESSGLDNLALAGFASDVGNPAMPATLPVRPLWLPTGAGGMFTSDGPTLRAAVDILEPYVGGSAPVFDAFEAGLGLVAAQAPPGGSAIVALLGGGDDGDTSDSSRRAKLASLREQRDESGLQVVLISGAPIHELTDRLELAELASALRAPAISLGAFQSWGSGSYAALDLAADLIDGAPVASLSAVINVKADRQNTFTAGAILYGLVYAESTVCPMGCWWFPLEFAVEIP